MPPLRVALAMLFWFSAWVSGADAPAAGEEKLNPAITSAPLNTWVRLHAQKEGDEVRFQRQNHGGGCFDSKRCRIVLFGSDTHGKNWMNSPVLFDVVEGKWSRLYPDDDKSTYKANADGLPVAGEKGDHPWAMHTFGTVIYDHERDEMVVCCYDEHMKPGRFCNDLKDVWGTVKKHPTWTFSFAKNEWKALDCDAVHFFPNACAWDSDRKVVVGYGGGVWELGGEPRKWTRVADRALCGYHNNATYDAKNKAVLVFGSHENSNDMIVYRAEPKEHQKKPTAGLRPPKDQHNPMCFEPTLGKAVVLVDRANEKTPAEKTTETWLYDTAADAWTQVPEATLPFGCGMNYTFYYDPRHRACLLVTGTYGRGTEVYGVRLSEKAGK